MRCSIACTRALRAHAVSHFLSANQSTFSTHPASMRICRACALPPRFTYSVWHDSRCLVRSSCRKPCQRQPSAEEQPHRERGGADGGVRAQSACELAKKIAMLPLARRRLASEHAQQSVGTAPAERSCGTCAACCTFDHVRRPLAEQQAASVAAHIERGSSNFGRQCTRRRCLRQRCRRRRKTAQTKANSLCPLLSGRPPSPRFGN